MKIRNYIIAGAILATGCAAYLGLNKSFDKIKNIPRSVQASVKQDSIENILEDKYDIELTKEINGHQLPANDMYITTFNLPNGRGAFHIKNVDDYYMAMRFDYVNLNKRMGCEYDNIAQKWWKLNNPDGKLYDSEASKFWKNKKVLVYNLKRDKAVVCIAQDWGPAAFVVRRAKKQVIDASNKTVQYLFNKRCSGWSSKNQVYVYLLEDQNIKTGPIY